ncbi:MAG: CHAD domain-containing protein [Opitutales bacterium]|nr:CHAD domain-containing protein [Opitutales bacterium]
MSLPAVWWPSDEEFARRVLADVRRRFTVVTEGRETVAAQCFETFDWRLWESGLVLARTARPARWLLTRVDDRSTVAREMSGKGNPRRIFSHGFPPGALRDRLRDVCGIRAVLPAGRYRESREFFALCNGDGKIVCRLVLEKASATEPRGGKVPLSAAGFRLTPLKGYSREAREAAACLAEMGCRASGESAHPALLAFASVDREPCDYSSKARVDLPQAIAAADACRRIHLFSLDVAERNLPGISEDLDTEFLHDFRVALRRSRSALSLVKGVFPPKVEKRFGKDLAKIQRATNRLRDLDVHLLEREAFEALLPPELHAGLEGLFRQLAGEREQALRRCLESLERPATSEILRDWRAFLELPADSAAPRAREPAEALGRKLLRKRFRRILKDGRAIGAKTPDAALHKLRLQVKKLRYLLEFFGSLLPADETASFVKRFRKLQNILGRFNDLCNQETWVRRRLEAAEAKEGTSTELAASLGGLLSELGRARSAERAKFGRAFARLDDPAVRARAKALFGGKEGKG